MGIGRGIHYFGAFLLLVSTVLLIVVSISAPVVNDISLLWVDLDNSSPASEVTFGTFGWCILDFNGRDQCSSSNVGYNPARVMRSIDGTSFSNLSEDTPEALTRVFVLHPVACGLCFIAFLLCLGAGTVGSLLASLVSGLSFVVILVALICDFVGLAIIKRRVDRDDSGADAHWGAAIWLVLVSAILTLIATIIVFVTCCAGRTKRRREEKKMSEYHETAPLYPRRHFWQRRRV